MFSHITEAIYNYNLPNISNFTSHRINTVRHGSESSSYLGPWKYNIRKSVNSDFSIVTMRRIAIVFFELGVVKNLMQKF